MSFTGVTRAPLPIPDVNQLRVGQRPSTPTFFLRSTPPVFTVLNVGGSNTNQDFAFRPAEIPTYLQFVPTAIKISRGVLPVEPFTTTKTLQLAIGGAGSVSSNLTVTRSFASSILGFTVVAVELSLASEPPPAQVAAIESLRSLRRRRRVWKEWQV